MILIFSISACTHVREKELEIESADTHHLAIKIGEHVAEKIQRIEQHAENLDQPVRVILKDSVRNLRMDFNYWKSTSREAADSTLSQVPDMKPEVNSLIQNDLRDRVIQLNIRAQKILDQLNNKNNNDPSDKKTIAPGYSA